MDEKEFLAELDRRYRSIGKFVHEFSTLEFWLEAHLRKTIRLEKRFSRAVTPNLDFAALCRSLGAALKERAKSEEQMSAVEKIIKRCLRINDDRNRIVHGSWLLHLGAFHTSRQSLKTNFHFQEADEIEKLSEEISAVTGALDELVSKIDPEAEAWKEG